MAGHFECIGFDDIIVAIEQAVRTGQRRERADGVSFVWRDESEASVVVHTVEDSVVDAFPTFATDLRLRAHPRGIASGAHELDGALHVELRDERGEIIYPFAIQLEDVDRVGALLPVSEPTEVRVSGFAERIEAWRDAESFSAEQPEIHAGMKIGPESLIPIGLFEQSEKRGLLRRRKREPLPAAIQARVLLSGAIEERETRRNTVSSAEFLKLRTRTYGATFDILASPNEVPDDVSPGWVVQVEAWMVGTIDV